VISAGLTDVDFRLSATRGGSAIDLTTSPTGSLIFGFNWDFAPATGMLTLAARPAGQITCDPVGLSIGGVLSADTVVGGAIPSTEGAIANAALTSALTNTPLTSADIDAASLAAFESLCGQSAGEYLVDPINFDAFLDRLAMSVGGYWTFSRAGKLQMGRLDYPTGSETPVVSFVEDDFAERTLQLKTRIVPRAQIKVLDNKNQTVQDPASLAGVVTPYNRALYSKAGQEHLGVSSDPPIAGESLADHRRATFPPVAETNMVDDSFGGYGQAEADRRARLFRFPNAIWSGVTHHLVYDLKIGDPVQITHPKFTGIAFVVSIIERANAQSTIEFFSQLTDVYPTADLEPAR
jgi:hypothetical protein